MLKLLVAALPFIVSATHPNVMSPASTESGIAPWEHPEVVRVDCMEGRGSAFRIGPHRLLSVAHVTTLHGCTINGQPFTVVSSSGDFSILRTQAASHNYLDVDCGGYVMSRRYLAVGFALGLDTLTTVDLDATTQTQGQLSLLTSVGTVIPGQSGGPVIDEQTGKVVGTVNTYNAEDGVSGSVPLKDTAVCHA